MIRDGGWGVDYIYTNVLEKEQNNMWCATVEVRMQVSILRPLHEIAKLSASQI